MKVFGIGYPKTGTTTLGHCLKQLGFKHFFWNRAFATKVLRGNTDEALRISEQFDSFEDLPWPSLYKLMDERHPDAKFVLTIRKDVSTWYRSQQRHAEQLGPTEVRQLFYGYAMAHKHRDSLITQYERHNREVLEYFKDRPGKLLVVCWEQDPSWGKLCAFLDKKIPEAPFPHRDPLKKTTPLRYVQRYLRHIKHGLEVISQLSRRTKV